MRREGSSYMYVIGENSGGEGRGGAGAKGL